LKTRPPRLIACAALLAAFAVPLKLHAQTPARPPADGDFHTKLVLTPGEQRVEPEDLVDIELIRNSPDWQAETNDLVQQYINYYQGRGRSTMEVGIRRSGRFVQMARRIFREEGVPEDIIWLAQVESGWSTRAMSWAAATGLWQFPASKAKRYGLRVTPWIDERRGFEKATRAAARYLKDLYNHFGSWELALAAYHTSQKDIVRAVARANSTNYWKIRPYLVREARNYVPAVLATILIAKNPEKYGFGAVRPDPPLAYDVVEVPAATSLYLVARATEASVDEIRTLNPELMRDVTPRGQSYRMRVPAGRAEQFIRLLKDIPKGKRDRVPEKGPRLMVIKAWPGDTPARLAGRYNVPAGGWRG